MGIPGRSAKQLQPMRLLFVHQNFPGQFKHLAPALVQQGHQVDALCWGQGGPETWQGVNVHRYRASRGSTPAIHPWLVDLETKVIRGEACLQAARTLAASGYIPDAIIAHPGWGESLFLRQVWPHTPLGIYCEFHYSFTGADVGFDPEFSQPDPIADACRLRLKTINNLLHFDDACAGICPTQWQASTFPEPFASRISVIHDGIDTDRLIPDANARVTLSSADGTSFTLSRDDEVITFVNRNLEPYRGYHIFMRALPDLLRRRPHARILLVGGDEVSYGSRPDPRRYGQRSWRDIFAAEVRPAITDDDWQRVHFLGKIAYPTFINLLQLSTVHVYLTYPFVLSWSLLEAMSIGCAIVASDTAPLREVINHDETGRLVDFFDHQALADAVIALLDDPAARQRLGDAARAFAIAHYDLHSHCLPRQLDWVQQLASSGPGG
jgi:glycosyltransferase involved in cell wall biosynthesis